MYGMPACLPAWPGPALLAPLQPEPCSRSAQTCWHWCVGASDPVSGQSTMVDATLDEIFADFSDSTPGCSVGVIRGGEVVAARGYGQSQLEYALPIDAESTIFHVASVSKQFTAFAVTLLSHERPEVLQLDDPVAKHLPWLPDLGATVTVRQMMHHTSGIRDQWELLVLGGWRMDDVLTTEMILDLMARQRELNFAPNSEYMYCNMGYLLLAQVVEAVSGVSFGAFCEQRIFAPLGMAHTHVHDDHELIVPGRAYSYNSAGEPGKFKKAVLSYANAVRWKSDSFYQ